MRLPRARGPIVASIGLLLLLPIAATPVAGAVLVDEPFTYPDGNLADYDPPWTALLSPGIKPIQVIGNEVRSESSPTDGEDCVRTFPPQATNAKTYYSFKLLVPSTGPAGPAIIEQPINSVVALYDVGGAVLRNMIGVGIKLYGTGDYTLQQYGGPGFPYTLTWLDDMKFDVRYTVVAAYDAATGTHEMWVDPLSEASPHVTDSNAASGGTSVDAVMIRQRNVSFATRCYHFIDDLKVGDSFLEVYTPPIAPLNPDHLQTFSLGSPPFTGTSVNFATAPIPADFFGPGSDPFDGIIYFNGDPFDPAAFGNTDTRVLRAADPFERADPPHPYPVTVPIEIVELSLVSAEPITVTSGTSPTLWDVRLDIVDPQQQGQMLATKTHTNGGVFDATLPVQPLFTFIRIDVPGEVRLLPAPQPFIMVFEDVPWVHDVDPALGVYVPPGANLVPGVLETFPGGGVSQRPVGTLAQQLAPVTGHSIPTPGLPDAEHTISGPEMAPDGVPAASPLALGALGVMILAAGVVLLRRRTTRTTA